MLLDSLLKIFYVGPISTQYFFFQVFQDFLSCKILKIALHTLLGLPYFEDQKRGYFSDIGYTFKDIDGRDYLGCGPQNAVYTIN